MDKKIHDRLEQFLHAINVDKDYIKGHDIGREMLLNGEDKQLAKLFASIAGLAQQHSNNKVSGYLKFRKMVVDRLAEMPNHPFDEAHLMSEFNKLDDVLNNTGKEIKGKNSLYLYIKKSE
ncbi:hypothetical protein [Salipaludibacillus daqingensis]|uniref:hypothetical protein n=1 Tax=Salipaludibacillus daqingensis TaxID=3041001 RepID=UPI002476B36E|nr:hypothetical protein [Salipaludibacillus daqingensis]